jgi:hypothetical protein
MGFMGFMGVMRFMRFMVHGVRRLEGFLTFMGCDGSSAVNWRNASSPNQT